MAELFIAAAEIDVAAVCDGNLGRDDETAGKFF